MSPFSAKMFPRHILQAAGTFLNSWQCIDFIQDFCVFHEGKAFFNDLPTKFYKKVRPLKNREFCHNLLRLRIDDFSNTEPKSNNLNSVDVSQVSA